MSQSLRLEWRQQMCGVDFNAQISIWRSERSQTNAILHHQRRRCRSLARFARPPSSSSFSLPPPSSPPPAPNQSKTKQDVSIPIDNATGSHRGFGFVEFEEAADAAAAALNMDSAELFGRTLRVNQSQSRIGGGGNKREAVWADEDAWNERAEADNLDASAAFKRREVGGGGGGGGAAAAEAAAREQQRPSSSVGAAAPDPMAAAEAALG